MKHASKEQKKIFKPLRMTVLRCAGSGKCVLINTLVGCIRKMFNYNSVLLTAPTGAAAYNVGGQTIHREFLCEHKGKSMKYLVKF